ncbi:MAG: LysR family transcriptional regulator [Verrucomicrobiales bacterium]|nr:LysR family transcriptional regulator [Verrucomicrobiales bacterium]
MPRRHAGPVELRHLRYFLAVADHLNFTRAAVKLRVAQPALSRQIRQLEEELGVALFERNRRAVHLTPAGEAFLAEARSVLAQSERAIQVAQATVDPHDAALRIGYVWGLFHSRVPAVVEKFRRRFPQVAVHLFDYTATEQVAALADGRLDLGFIGFEEEAESAGLERRRIGRCAFVIALPTAHRAARRRRVDLASLASEMFFAISERTYPGAARLVADACRAAGFRPRILQAAERGHTLLGLVAGQCGVALVPESLADLPHPGVVLRPLVNPPTADLLVAWPPRRPNAVRDKFLMILEELGGTA